MRDFKIKDCFICNFCRNECKGPCNDIKEAILNGKIKKGSKEYLENIDLTTDRKQIIKCLGKYCDRPCKHQDLNAKPPIEALVRAIKYLGNKCNQLLKHPNK